MNLDQLADRLKRRGCRDVWYFHTDHFEPWSVRIDEASARAVDRMAAQARGSSYGRRLSLFYAVFIPFHLDVGGTAGDRVPGDAIVFGGRSENQEALARDAIRPLVAADAHEMHLHVHHEFWTRNQGNYPRAIWQWVNAHGSPEDDARRLDLHFRLCKEAIARETGAPFDRWGFVHGNWALNGSDSDICEIDDEISIVMRNGGIGDFTFPAGRGHCDPKLETPFACLPVRQLRGYDRNEADPRPIAAGSRAMTQDRYFIWNSRIKHKFSSLDYFSAGARDLLKTPDEILGQWFDNSVALDGSLFIKTHAHSMNAAYRLGEPDGVIPHCYPDTVALFDGLARVCDRAGIALRLATVHEIVERWRDVDGAPKPAALAPAANIPPSPPDNALAHRLRGPFIADGGAAWRIGIPSAFHAVTDNDEDPARCPLRLLEDGNPLGPGHELHQHIRDEGGGRYSFWKSGLWFSTPDGSDPNTNGRAYIVDRGDSEGRR